MPSTSRQLESRACSDIQEFEAFRQQAWRKDALMQQTGGADAFIDAAAGVIRKNVLQTLKYGSPSAKYVQAMRRNGVPDADLDRALARAWLDASDTFEVPRRPASAAFFGTAALLTYSVLIVLVLMILAVLYLRHAAPTLAEQLLGVPPVFAIAGVPLAGGLFLLLRKLVH